MLKTFNPGLNPGGSAGPNQAGAGEFPPRPGVYAPVSVAPMIDKTHRHFRRFLRLLTRQTLLYTEMLTPSAIIHGDRNKLLDFDEIERPIALQLGGDDPREMAEAIRIAEDWGYDEYNLNVGCPSDRVQNKNFGACLMADSPRVAELLNAMYESGTRPVTVKHRIGIQSRIKALDLSSYEHMRDFVLRLKDGPAQRYSVHARVAILEGLSPKENRNIPPIRYDEVYRLKEEFPGLHIEINGGIKTHGEIASHLQRCDGVMLGRLSYERPWRFASMDRLYYGRQTADYRTPGPDDILDPTRREILNEYFDYMKEWSERGMNVRSLVWPVLELFAGQPGSRRWKQTLSRALPRGMSSTRFLDEGLACAPSDFLDIRASRDPLTSE
ncbi:tRNA dihydrouridine(20/20a) synthase DusA [Salinispira pacifica]|uniref:tRNA-dihydrouridine(20/20a) synthase n=1 Tax=Salinispira pacifica TaxID=1307761 RepID=V5WDD2_9SPIO|nr:tRNA dihydrouridine(20/20a) synthase DusA [Salinispira pacifica]AHC13833.1 tRNA dihydrouridine synthase A [Salinispira pacifica]